MESYNSVLHGDGANRQALSLCYIGKITIINLDAVSNIDTEIIVYTTVILYAVDGRSLPDLLYFLYTQIWFEEMSIATVPVGTFPSSTVFTFFTRCLLKSRISAVICFCQRKFRAINNEIRFCPLPFESRCFKRVPQMIYLERWIHKSGLPYLTDWAFRRSRDAEKFYLVVVKKVYIFFYPFLIEWPI